jgi:hypothetical protein
MIGDYSSVESTHEDNDDNCSYSSKSIDGEEEVHGGRWTKEEHVLFLNAIKTYGREVSTYLSWY